MGYVEWIQWDWNRLVNMSGKEMHSKLVEDHSGESEKILAGEDTSAARSFRGDTTSMHAGF